jgi:hypothetical protein
MPTETAPRTRTRPDCLSRFACCCSHGRLQRRAASQKENLRVVLGSVGGAYAQSVRARRRLPQRRRRGLACGPEPPRGQGSTRGSVQHTPLRIRESKLLSKAALMCPAYRYPLTLIPD